MFASRLCRYAVTTRGQLASITNMIRMNDLPSRRAGRLPSEQMTMTGLEDLVKDRARGVMSNGRSRTSGRRGEGKFAAMPPLERQIEGLDEALVGRVIKKLPAIEPETTAVLLTGSYATGRVAVASDLDLMAITPSPRIGYRTWFEQQGRDAPLHVSAGATTADEWLADGADPARWSFGFPAINTAAYLWTDEATRERLGTDPSLRHPASGPELEDFLDFVLKAKRSARGGDELGLRRFAQGAASLAPTLLIPLNGERIVCDSRDALDAALSLAVAPDNYAADLPVCLGLTSATGAEVKTAVARLGRQLLAFLRERAPDVDDQPELARYLADGTLERHLGLIE